MTWRIVRQGTHYCEHLRYVTYQLQTEPPIPGVECQDCGRKVEVWPDDANPEPWPERTDGHWSLRETFSDTASPTK